MTILDMHIAVRQELDKSQSFELPNFQPEQIDYWLNKSFEILVEDTAYPKEEGKPSFEETQQIIDELREIVKPDVSVIPTVNTVSDKEVSFISKLPVDYKHLVRHTCRTSYSSEQGEVEQTVSGIITTQDKFNIRYKDPFWEPIPSEPLYFIRSDSIEYKTKGNFEVKETCITYIQKTPRMQLGSHYTNPTADVDCTIESEYVQYKIINNAANMMLENIESQRYQTNLNELNKTN